MAYTGTTAAILTNYSEVLKTFYLPAIQEQLNDENILSRMIDVNEQDVSGTDATIEMHYGRTKGIGARKDGGALPEADYQKHKTCVVPMRYNYARVTFSGPTLAATRDEKGAYARVMNTEIMGAVKDMKKEVNRQLWGCGYGILARWRSTESGTSYTVQKKYRNNSAGGDGFGSTFGAKYLNEIAAGVALVMGSTSTSKFTTTTLDTTSIAVSAVTESADYDTITVTDPSVTEAAGTVYVRPANTESLTASTAAGGLRYEMMGLRGIITDEDLDEIAFFDGTNTGTATNDPLQTLDVATYTWFKSYVDKASTRYGAQRALTEEMMQKAFDKVEEAAGKGYGPDLIVCGNPIRREFFKVMDAKRREVNTMTLEGGFDAVKFNGIPLVTDPDCPDGEMYFITTKDLQIYRMSDYEWMMKDGALLARITGYDAYEAALLRYAELGCKRRNSHGVIADLAYSN